MYRYRYRYRYGNVMYLQDILKFEAGRDYSPHLMPKGKGAGKNPAKIYEREERKRMVEEHMPGEEKRLAPESHRKLLRFLKDQRKELRDFVKETSEERFRGVLLEEDDDHVDQDDVIVDDIVEDISDDDMISEESHVSEISSDSEFDW